MIFLIVTFLSFIFTILITPYLINFLVEKGFVDNPNGEERRMHSNPVPRLGGIAIFIAVMMIAIFFYQGFLLKIFFIIGAVIVLLLGIYDDLKNVRWHFKFIFQSVAALLLLFSLYDNNVTEVLFFSVLIDPVFGYPVLFILIVSLLNSFNLMDGLDGLVTGFSLIIASMCFLLGYGKSFAFLPFLSASLIGATLGFLKFNGNPARIFLGDSGSLTLGYLISGLVIYISSELPVNLSLNQNNIPKQIDLVFVLIVFMVPLADMIKVIIIRLKKGKHIFLPDRNHLHHILYSKKIRHKTVVLLIHIISAAFAMLALYYAHFSNIYLIISFFVLFILFLFIEQIIELFIRKENLLAYGRQYKQIPLFFIRTYKKFILPLVSLLLLVLIILLLIIQLPAYQSDFAYFLLILVPAFLYSSISLKKNNYYAELLVLLNIIVFFLITGLNGLFYKLYYISDFFRININQMFIIIISFMVIFFILFKERIAGLRSQFLGGTDLTVAVFISFLYLSHQFIQIPNSYKISDTLLRSFLVFLFYKIIIVNYPKLHYYLYYFSFLIAVVAIGKVLL